MSEAERYHLGELAVALNPSHPRWSNPRIATGGRVLDIGCGAGQTLIAACPDRQGGMTEGVPDAQIRGGARAGCIACTADGCTKEGWAIGIDVEFEPLSLGRSLSNRILFACADATRLPFAPASFDMVICRVSLPMMNTAAALPEIARVLRPGGSLWMTLHPFRMIRTRARRGGWKAWVRVAYIVANSLLFWIAGRQFPFFRGRYESVQTEGGMRRALRRLGFAEVTAERGRCFLMTATKR